VHLRQLLLALRLDGVHALLQLVVGVQTAQALLLHVEVNGRQRRVCDDLGRLPAQH
jgi:hypothetical protein